MQGAVLLSGWDTALLMAPIFALAGFWLFGLDENFAAPKETGARRRRFSEMEYHGRTVMTDPDGRPWKASLSLGQPQGGDGRDGMRAETTEIKPAK